MTIRPHLREIKRFIGDQPRQQGLYITIIDDAGLISSANSLMVRSLELDNPRLTKTSFFDLIHPVHLPSFRHVLKNADGKDEKSQCELYIKNGQFHPMNWSVNPLVCDESGTRNFLCIGYEIMDREGTAQFNNLVHDHYHILLEGFSGITFHNMKGELLAANKKASEVFGTSLETLYSFRNVPELWKSQWVIQDESGQRVTFENTPFIKAMTTGKPQKAALLVHMSNGTRKWVQFNSRPLNNAGETFVLSHIIDISAEREQAEKLAAHEALISSFLQQTPNLSWVVDEEAQLIFASDTFYRYFNIDRNKTKGVKVTDMVPAHITRSLFENHMKVFATGEPQHSTERVKWADGTQMISYVHLYPIIGSPGKKLLAGQAVTLPDQTKLEKQLLGAHERVIAISKATSDAIWEWDMQSGQIFRNETLMEMIGYQQDNSRGLSWWLRRIHPEDRNRLADRVKDATENMNQSWQEKYRFKCADGNYKHVQDKGFVVYENGLPVKMIGSLQDISALRGLELELEEERNARQTEIAETATRVQEKERTRIGYELHDNVNQILSTAKLFIDMITASDPQQAELKQKSQDYLVTAIDEIRKLSKELATPQLREATLGDSIRTLVKDINLAGKLHIDFVNLLGEENLSPGKKTTLFRIVQEQIKNIMKHSGASTAAVTLETVDEYIEMHISDNGNGFVPKDTYQGIGLTNIQERANFYNGRVEITSAPGRGCNVQVRMPLH